MNINLTITGNTIAQFFRIVLFASLGIVLSMAGVGIMNNTWYFFGITLLVVLIDANARVQGHNE